MQVLNAQVAGAVAAIVYDDADEVLITPLLHTHNQPHTHTPPAPSRNAVNAFTTDPYHILHAFDCQFVPCTVMAWSYGQHFLTGWLPACRSL